MEVIGIVLLLFGLALSAALLSILLKIKTGIEELQVTVASNAQAPTPAPSRPQDPDPAAAIIEPPRVDLPLDERVSGLVRRAREFGVSSGGAVKAHSAELLEQAEGLSRVIPLLGEPELELAALESLVGALYAPPVMIPAWRLEDASPHLEEMGHELNYVRAELVSRFRNAGVEAIYPLPGESFFDATEHVDAGGSPGRTEDSAEDNLITGVLRPGVKYRGKVAFEAKVFRVVLDAPTAEGDVGW
ncbi:MAG: hypothetical protein ACAH95_08925 [Fimbriimonas sp.]